MSYNGEIKLTDFGVARARDREEHTEHGIIKGKVRYLSPEAAYAKEVDRRSDLFSLGIAFAEMLIMEPLRSGPNEMAMLLDIRKGEFDRSRFKQIPKPLRAVLNHALEVDPDKRYPDRRKIRRGPRLALRQHQRADVGSRGLDLHALALR